MRDHSTGETRQATAVIDTATPEIQAIPVDKTLEGVEIGTIRGGRVASASRQETGVISVLLVDDHALVREGLRQLLSLEEDIQVAAESANGHDAMKLVRALYPDVVLMDIRMPVVDGLAITRQIAREAPACAVIILSMYSLQEYVLEAMRSGARGYLLKSVSSRELAQAIRKVHEGGTLIEPGLTNTLVNEYRRLSGLVAPGSSIHALSEKEIEILRYVALGMSNKEIAGKLVYAEKTVKNYLSIIFQKLGIRDRTQAAIFALRHGLLADEETEEI